MPKMLIVHGGAPTAVINASLYGAIKEAKRSGKVDCILGAVHGTAGILNEQFTDLGGLSDEMMEKLRFSPASAIGTSRTPLEDRDYEKMASVLKKNDIVYVLFTGGNGSMDTCRKLSSVCTDQALIVGGIPKTIDNDLDLTDHAPGYGSAALFAARTMEEIAMDVRSLPIHVCIWNTWDGTPAGSRQAVAPPPRIPVLCRSPAPPAGLPDSLPSPCRPEPRDPPPGRFRTRRSHRPWLRDSPPVRAGQGSLLRGR